VLAPTRLRATGTTELADTGDANRGKIRPFAQTPDPGALRRRRIESCDESLKRLVARPHPSVFVVWSRRPTWSFGWQIKTFGGGEIRGRPCVIAEVHYPGDLGISLYNWTIGFGQLGRLQEGVEG
jgi:hypothetical protein